MRLLSSRPSDAAEMREAEAGLEFQTVAARPIAAAMGKPDQGNRDGGFVWHDNSKMREMPINPALHETRPRFCQRLRQRMEYIHMIRFELVGGPMAPMIPSPSPKGRFSNLDWVVCVKGTAGLMPPRRTFFLLEAANVVERQLRCREGSSSHITR
jgi:hypothetical protein